MEMLYKRAVRTAFYSIQTLHHIPTPQQQQQPHNMNDEHYSVYMPKTVNGEEVMTPLDGGMAYFAHHPAQIWVRVGTHVVPGEVGSELGTAAVVRRPLSFPAQPCREPSPTPFPIRETSSEGDVPPPTEISAEVSSWNGPHDQQGWEPHPSWGVGAEEEEESEDAGTWDTSEWAHWDKKVPDNEELMGELKEVRTVVDAVRGEMEAFEVAFRNQNVVSPIASWCVAELTSWLGHRPALRALGEEGDLHRAQDGFSQ